jgi:uncharacterized membrane protein
LRSRVFYFFILCILFGATQSLAQSRSFEWFRWDMVIDNIDTANNQFDATEIYDLNFNGRFTFGSALIPLERTEAIRIIDVRVDNIQLNPTCSQTSGTFCAQIVADGLSLVYYFPQPVVDRTVNIRIQYRVQGGLRVYDDYHMLNWYAVAQEHAARVGRSTVVVNIPDNVRVREGVDDVVTPDVEANIDVCVDYANCSVELAPYISAIDGQAVVIEAARSLNVDEPFEFIITYSPDNDMRKPAWQDAFDIERAFEENVLPILNLILLAVTALIGIGGPLFIYARFYQKGRDPDVGIVPEYISEPPSDLSPSAVGTLVDERAETEDILAGLVELGNRGYLVMEEDRTDGFFGIGAQTTFTFKRTDKSTDDLNTFEKLLINRVFGSAMTKELEDLKHKFYRSIPKLQSALYDELVERDYFPRSPEATRNLYRGWGMALLFIPFIGLFFLPEDGSFNISESMGVVLPMVAIIINGLFLLIMSNFMPAKTIEGARQAALWRAFRNYLERIQKYDDIESASDKFAQYLPYVIVFGLEKQWVKTFRHVDNPRMFPRWYYPRHLGGRWHGGFRAGSSPLSHADMLPGELVGQSGGGFSLDNASSGLADGLNAMSNGLTNMLNSASSAMTSRPSSSGGSSWSGGGGGSFGGGGGGGGGSRGFG